MGYKYQFITLAGFHALNYSIFDLVELQEKEFAAEERGYTATKHQREVGAGYFDAVTQAVTGGTSSITAMSGSTEEEQFEEKATDDAQAAA
jgi:isocitrate lyase